jgi:hypothetical protein
MKQTIGFSPPNSIIAVMDHGGGELPKWIRGQLVCASPSCLVIGTLMAADGETRITLTDEAPDDLQTLTQVFDGVLATPSLKLSVYSTQRAVIVEAKVPKARTHLQIWVNEDREPDDIRIVILDRVARKRKA